MQIQDPKNGACPEYLRDIMIGLNRSISLLLPQGRWGSLARVAICLIFSLPQLNTRVAAQTTAATSSFMTTPQALGMGQATRAIARSNSALVYNPAGMSAISIYSIDAQYFRSSGEENILGLNIVDSQTRYAKDQLALGLAYNHVLRGGDLTAWEGRGGLSLPVIRRRDFQILLGFTGRYTSNKATGQDGFDLDVGAMMIFNEVFNIGLVGEGVLDENVLTRLGGGVGFNHRIFTVDVDYLYNPSAEISYINSGLEFLLGDQFVLRGGYERVTLSEAEGKRNTLVVSESTIINPGQAGQWINVGLAVIDTSGGNGQFNLGYRRSLDDQAYLFGASFSFILVGDQREVYQ